MHQRQAELLKHLIRIYISSAEPVSSSALVGIDDILDVSSATIRNEMADLEGEGFVHQPHASAGRVPTEKGYRFYVDNFLEIRTILKEAEKRLQEAASNADADLVFKSIAKILAELTHEAVIVSFERDDMYYTGLSYLLSQPEFNTQEQVMSVSYLLDKCDEIGHELLQMVQEDETRVLIGKENPFGGSCALVISPFQQGLVGVLGPMRMDYDYTITLVNKAIKLLNENHF